MPVSEPPVHGAVGPGHRKAEGQDQVDSRPFAADRQDTARSKPPFDIRSAGALNLCVERDNLWAPWSVFAIWRNRQEAQRRSSQSVEQAFPAKRACSRAFSRKVDRLFDEENASKQRVREKVRFNQIALCSRRPLYLEMPLMDFRIEVPTVYLGSTMLPRRTRPAWVSNM